MIHATAIVHPQAQLHPTVTVGANFFSRLIFSG
jgi:acyl-[acyl carrier protein]--UDP-N-acetylglucosamine O-acyltransferase